jgi:hypothetical protein
MVIRVGSLILVLFLAWFALANRDPKTAQDRRPTDPDALDPKVLNLALRAASAAWERGVGAKHLLTVIDYSLPSTRRRLWVLDLEHDKVLFHELVAHGKGSGDNYATRFSDEEGSLQSSLGLFEATTTYRGQHGYSLRLKGLEEGFNERALERSIVIHGAWYVTEAFAAQHGRLGRSWGCPALDRAVAKEVIDTIKGGTLVFAYYPDEKWLSESRFLRDGSGP